LRGSQQSHQQPGPFHGIVAASVNRTRRPSMPCAHRPIALRLGPSSNGWALTPSAAGRSCGASSTWSWPRSGDLEGQAVRDAEMAW